MAQLLIDHFEKFAPLTEAEKAAIINSVTTFTAKKGTLLIKEGALKADTYFVLNGLVRQFKAVGDEEVTLNFFCEGQWIIAPTSFAEATPSPHSLICVENTTLVNGNETAAQELFQKFPRLETTSRAVMEMVFAEQQKDIASYLTETPEERYLKLLQRRPTIFQRVPQYQIATYLGIKPESLSRIRKRISRR